MRRFDQPQVAFIEEVFKRHPKVAILTRDLDHKAQIRFDQLVQGFLAAVALHLTSEYVLLILAQKRIAANLREVSRKDGPTVVGRFHADPFSASLTDDDDCRRPFGAVTQHNWLDPDIESA